MSPACEPLSRFVDGELSDAEAAAFRAHLASCETCARELHDLMMLEALSFSQQAARAEASNVAGNVSRPRSSRRWPMRAVATAVLVPMAAAAGWALWARSPTAGGPAGPAAAALPLEVARTRASEMRLAYAAADTFRPYDVARAAGERGHEQVPLSTLAALEAKGDLHGVGVGLALAGDDARADSYLAKAPASVDVGADRAALLLDRGQLPAAIAALDDVLAKSPRHPQALFNRGLLLRDLGLPLAAAEAFEVVAALGEAGWAAEASTRAQALRAEESRRQTAWKTALAAGRSMVAGGPLPADDVVDATPDVARHYLYHALRAATSSERALQLEPLARRLDARAGGHVLTDLVERASKDDFTRRKAWAGTYAKVLASEDALDARGVATYLAQLRSAGESDMLFGALLLTDQASAHVDEVSRIAAASRDPWLQAIAARVLAADLSAKNDVARAEETLRTAIASCTAAHVDWQCAQLEQPLGTLLAAEMRTTEARAVALSGLARSRSFAEEMVQKFLLRLADVARLEGSMALLGAYAREAELLAPDDCLLVRADRLELAVARVTALDPEGADRELAATPRCGKPITNLMADAIVSSLRLGGKPAAAATLASDLAEARKAMTPGDQASADVVLARFLSLHDAEAGEHLARRALDDATRLPESDTAARKAEAYARLTLATDAAAQGRGQDALTEIAQGAHSSAAAAIADGCALGVAIDDDRALAVTRDAEGTSTVDLRKRAAATLTPDSVVSSGTLARLAQCNTVRVYALPPLHGLSRLLPPGIAWAYTTDASTGAAAAPKRVVVSDAIPPASLDLARLGDWGPPPDGAVWLHGEGATPSAVLAQIGDATEVEMHAHGVVDAAESSAAMIALSPERGGRYALTASDLRASSLTGHPVVVLGACHAAQTAAYLHEAWSLPSAFVRAGARSVLASPSEIRDAEARRFFDAVLARIRQGAAPAVALRDERVLWLARDPASWVVDVVDFE